jgi:rhodanese-related sulfurtransferase
MKKILKILLIILITTGCSKGNNINQYKDIDCNESKELIRDGAILIDVRTEAEYNTGYIEGAINISSENIMDIIDETIVNKEVKIIVYCQSGGRSTKVAEKLINEGYKNVYNLGGINNCVNENTLIPKK